MEGEASLPLLPLKHLYTCSTCVCAGCSMAVCPFCHTCHKMLFPLLLEGILFRGELCCALLFLSCLKSIAEEVTEINLDILVLNFLDLDLPNHFNHTIAVTSLQHPDLTIFDICVALYCNKNIYSDIQSRTVLRALLIFPRLHCRVQNS